MTKTTRLLLAALLGAALSSLAIANTLHQASEVKSSAPATKDSDAAHCHAMHDSHAMHQQESMQHMPAMHQMHMKHHPEHQHEMHDMPLPSTGQDTPKKSF